MEISGGPSTKMKIQPTKETQSGEDTPGTLTFACDGCLSIYLVEEASPSFTHYLVLKILFTPNRHFTLQKAGFYSFLFFFFVLRLTNLSNKLKLSIYLYALV